MQVAIDSIREFPSRNDGKPTVRLGGKYVDEFGQLATGHTFVKVDHRNWHQWSEVLEAVARNKGHWVIVDNVKMFNRKTGNWNADSKPVVIDIAIKQKENV